MAEVTRSGGFPWNRQRDPFGRSVDPADLQQLVDRTDWLHERSVRHDSRIGSLEYAARPLLARAAALAVVVAQLVLMTQPWFVLNPANDEASSSTAGPWTLVGVLDGIDSLDLSYLLVALLPVAVYLAAIVLVSVAAFLGSSRLWVWSVVGCVVAAVVAVVQLGLVSGAGEDADTVHVLAPGVLALLLWLVAAACVGAMNEPR